MGIEESIEAAKAKALTVEADKDKELFEKGVIEVRRNHWPYKKPTVYFKKDGMDEHTDLKFCSGYIALADSVKAGEISDVKILPYHQGIMYESSVMGIENLRDNNNNYHCPSKKMHVLKGSMAGFYLSGKIHDADVESLLASLLKKRPEIAQDVKQQIEKYD